MRRARRRRQFIGRHAGNGRGGAAHAPCAPPPPPAAARYALRRPPPFSPPLRAAAHALWRAAAMTCFSGSAIRLRVLSRLLRFQPAALHAFEQYRTERFGVENSLPHSLHLTAITLPISLSILALHRLQWAGRAPPYGAKPRPHSAQAYGSAGAALRLGLLAPRPAGGGRFPCALALRAAAHALMRARPMARFSGSAAYLRWYSRLRRRTATVRHSSEQYRTERVFVGNALPHSLQSTLIFRAISLSALAVQRLQ